MKSPLETVRDFCIIQLELLKERHLKLRREIEDCHLQEEFLLSTLRDLGNSSETEGDIIKKLLNTYRSVHK